MTDDRRFMLYVEQAEALYRDLSQILKEAEDDGFHKDAILHMVQFRKLPDPVREEVQEFGSVGAIVDTRQESFDL